jgi:hypothetical protein
MPLEKTIACRAARHHGVPVRLVTNKGDTDQAVETTPRENVDGRAECVAAVVAKCNHVALDRRHAMRVALAADKLDALLKAKREGDDLLLHKVEFGQKEAAEGVARVESAKVVAVANVELGQSVMARHIDIAVRAKRRATRLVVGVNGLGRRARREHKASVRTKQITISPCVLEAREGGRAGERRHC